MKLVCAKRADCSVLVDVTVQRVFVGPKTMIFMKMETMNMCCPCCEPFFCEECDVNCMEECACYWNEDESKCGFCLELWSEHTTAEAISCRRDLGHDDEE